MPVKVMETYISTLVMLQILSTYGRRHQGYGCSPEMLDLMSEAFVLSIEPCLENIWTNELQTAWLRLFEFISFGMKRGFETTSDSVCSTRSPPSSFNLFLPALGARKSHDIGSDRPIIRIWNGSTGSASLPASPTKKTTTTTSALFGVGYFRPQRSCSGRLEVNGMGSRATDCLAGACFMNLESQ